jgi:hypothetical protein
MKKVPSTRPGGLSPSRSPNKPLSVLTSEAIKTARTSTRNFKRIADAIDLLQKKRANARRSEEDLSNQEIYAIILQERLNKKDSKLEKPSKKAIEAKKSEIAAMREVLDQLMRELEGRRETLELFKSFFGHLVREFRKHIRGYQETEKERERADWGRHDLGNTGPPKMIERLRKSKSTNEMNNSLQKLAKIVHFAQKKAKEVKETEPEAMKPEEAVKAWADRRRSSFVNRKSKMPGVASLDNLIYLGNTLDRKPTGILAQALMKESDEIRSRTSTMRYQIGQRNQFSTQTGVLNKTNIRQSVMGESENIVNIRDYVKAQKVHGKKSQVEIIDILQSQGRVPEDPIEEETSQANSNLSESIIEEVKEDLKNKMMKQNHASYGEGDGFDYKVVVPNFQPVKVSFKVGLNEARGPPASHMVVQKDRVFKNFCIHEIEWHFKNKGLSGVRIILKNWTTGFMLGGTFHGKIGDFVDVCRFNKDERIAKIEFAFDSTAIRFLEFVTTDGRKFLNGIDRKEALTMGLNFVNRYYPQEIMLCKFLCQFNKTTQLVDYIRFLFVRAILY